MTPVFSAKGSAWTPCWGNYLHYGFELIAVIGDPSDMVMRSEPATFFPFAAAVVRCTANIVRCSQLTSVLVFFSPWQRFTASSQGSRTPASSLCCGISFCRIRESLESEANRWWCCWTQPEQSPCSRIGDSTGNLGCVSEGCTQTQGQRCLLCPAAHLTARHVCVCTRTCTAVFFFLCLFFSLTLCRGIGCNQRQS